MTKKINSYRFGFLAEFIAAMLLVCKGYKICAWRYKTKVGEIDLIARRHGTVAFIEVKARKDLSTALASLTPRMQSRIVRAARLYMAENERLSAHDLRFDLIALGLPLRWRHLDNAWRPST